MSNENPRPKRIPKKNKRTPAVRQGNPQQPVDSPPAKSDKPAPTQRSARRPANQRQAAPRSQQPEPQQPVSLRPEGIADPIRAAGSKPAQVAAERATSAVRSVAAPKIQAERDIELSWIKRLRDSLWTMPAWALSLLVHVVIVLALALVTAVVVDQEPEVVIATSISAEEEPMEEFSEIEMEEPEELIEEEPLFQPDMPEMPKLTFDESAMAPSETVANGEPTRVAANSGSAGDMADTAGSPQRGSETGKAVSFYGSKSKGNRFVFLIDNSPNMNNEGRMEMACAQLMQAVGQMSKKQSFYVIFYSNRAYPLFFPDSAKDLVEATKKNKQQLDAWLRTVELCDSRPGGSQAIEDTLQMAHDLSPSTIYFLTDGDYSGTVKKVLEDQPLPCPLNVIGLLPREDKSHTQTFAKTMSKLETFSQLADSNHGQFTGVPSNPNIPGDTFIERRKAEPGPVWGTYR